MASGTGIAGGSSESTYARMTRVISSSANKVKMSVPSVNSVASIIIIIVTVKI
jgi:hypothetical protein